IVVPSERVVVALNAPPIGGLDFVIVTFVPPVFVSVNDFEAVPPAATLPYSSASGVIFSTPGLPAEPTSATEDGPTFVSSVSSPLKLPSAVGSKVTCTVTASPAARTLPASGAPVTKNGAPGATTLLIVNGAPPTLRNVAAEEILPPTVVPPNDSSTGEASTLASAGWPVPCSEKVVVPVLVSTLSVVACRPDFVGLKVTGTWSVCPAPIVAGTAGLVVPMTNCELPVEMAFTVTALFAVSVIVFSLDWPSVVVGKVVEGPLSGGVTGEPNANTFPSRLPTNSLLAPTPGVPNLDPVPIGALQRSTGFPFTGTGSYARSWAPSPVPFGIHSLHTSADPEVVPSEVMTGAPVPKPQASEEVACSDSVGLPSPLTPYW